jgi:hypothetical protein
MRAVSSLEAGRLSVNGLTLGLTLAQVLSRLGPPMTRQHIPDDGATLLKYPGAYDHFSLLFARDNRLVEMQSGTTLELDGRPFLEAGDDDYRVELRLGVASETLHEPYASENARDSWSGTIRVYLVAGGTLTAVSVESAVVAFNYRI